MFLIDNVFGLRVSGNENQEAVRPLMRLRKADVFFMMERDVREREIYRSRTLGRKRASGLTAVCVSDETAMMMENGRYVLDAVADEQQRKVR